MLNAPKDTPDPCVLVIFGASGDLTKRKLIPALFELDHQGRLPEKFCVLGSSRTKMTDEEFRAHLKPMVAEHVTNFDEQHWQWFSGRLHYQTGSATDPADYSALKQRINALGIDRGLCAGTAGVTAQPNTLFYLSVAPALSPTIIQNLGASGVINEGKRWCAIDDAEHGVLPWQRVIIEKPFGNDLSSAQELNSIVASVFDEDAVYRIDHYLGKELVQNILVMRFANTMFEPLWNNQYVEHIQVTAAESIGVGSRAANFYDAAGATRDMIQSHLLQVLALIAMEPPTRYESTAIRREKEKVLSACHLFSPEDVAKHAVLARYAASNNPHDEDAGRGYAQLDGVNNDHPTETFSALKLHFDNWRWSGVPFYVRSGKKLARKLTEVVVQFRQPPACLFPNVEPFRSGGCRPANRIVINIAPDEGVSLRFEAKVPGPKFIIESVKADFDYEYVFDAQVSEAYGPLMLDAMRGDQTLFKRADEVEATWRIVDPVISSSELHDKMCEYAPGSWGPNAADELLARSEHQWHNPAVGEKR